MEESKDPDAAPSFLTQAGGDWTIVVWPTLKTEGSGTTTTMLRAGLALAAWALMAVVLGTPVIVVSIFAHSRRLYAWASLSFARAMLRVAGADVTIEGQERLDGSSPCILIGNHQSALDIPLILLATGGHVRFFAKHSLFRLPFFGWALRCVGHVPIDRSCAQRAVRKATNALRRNEGRPISFALFPEGTRSRDGRLLPFRRGALKMALRAGLPIVPFCIQGAIAVNHRDEFRLRPGPIRITLGPPISGKELASMSADTLQDRIRGWLGNELARPWPRCSDQRTLLPIAEKG